ncbi:MAG: TIM barrel protein [Chloroflexota bacterium]
MRLGVVGMMPKTLDEITPQHLATIRELNLTGVGMGLPGTEMGSVTDATVERTRQLFSDTEMDFAQLIVGFGGCLFDLDPAVRDDLVAQIRDGIGLSKRVGAHVCLIRTGSLSPTGSYSPSKENHRPECKERLVDSLTQIAETADSVGQAVVIETHVLTIMNSPEVNAEILQTIGSDRLQVVMDYVNHFQALHQVYNSTERINHIFDIMGPISAIGHCKDISVRDGFVTHFDEEIPGEGELDMATALRRWHEFHPDGYMMLEHLPEEQYPLASRNTHRILAEAGISVY